MVASRSTVEAVFDIMKRNLSPNQLRTVLTELQSVEGNKSFMDTVSALTKLYVRTAAAENKR
jgi:hypothetical protein